MIKRDDVIGMNNRERMALLRAGHAIAPAALDDFAYRGISLGLPKLVERLTWTTFQKTFYRDPSTGHLRGWNVRVEQRGLDAETVPKMKHGAPFTFGHYRVIAPSEVRVPDGCDRGLVIHYGLGGNAALDPINRGRDPLVALNEGDASLLLGWTYLDVFGLLVSTPSFFLLEREHPVAYVANP